jgi:hypothetical protein
LFSLICRLLFNKVVWFVCSSVLIC